MKVQTVKISEVKKESAQPVLPETKAQKAANPRLSFLPKKKLITENKIESEKNKHLADIAFVLRKHQDFLKIQEEVTKAHNNYNRILGYSKEEGDNAEYWRNQLSFYEKSIHLAKEKVQEEVENLLKKGVNVTEIENKKLITENKIAELDEKLEDLPNLREELVSSTEKKRKCN